MTHKKYFSLAFTIVYILFSLAVRANAATENAGYDNNTSTHTDRQPDAAAQGKNSPLSQEAHSKVPHSKAHAPHSEELPHIHKFHKERVKKIRKHHGKCWLLSQVLLFLCHASVLYISYLHMVH
jgi:hypothetical protein